MNQVAIIAALSNLLVEATDKCDKLESDLQRAKQDYLWAQEDLDASHREQHRLHEAAASRKISDDQLPIQKTIGEIIKEKLGESK